MNENDLSSFIFKMITGIRKATSIFILFDPLPFSDGHPKLPLQSTSLPARLPDLLKKEIRICQGGNGQNGTETKQRSFK